MAQTKAPNTLRGYGASWKVFREWCEAHSKCTIPATSDTLTLFLTWARHNYKMATIRLHMAAIRHEHEQLGLTWAVSPEVLDLVASIAREKARTESSGAEAGKQRITLAQLRKISRRLDTSRPIDKRNRALILLGFASSWRRSELARLTLKDVTFEEPGMRLWQAYSKGDQQGAGCESVIPYGKNEVTCAVRALKAWVKARGDWQGPLFVRFGSHGEEMTRDALADYRMCEIVKAQLEGIGEDPDNYGAHSMRSGCVTALAESGASLRAIMDHTGHKSLDTVMRYVKSSGKAYVANPLSRVL
jgi:integrase